MADKRYEMSVIFHSGLSQDEIVVAFWKTFGDNASISLTEIPEEDPDAVGGWTDLVTQPESK